MNSDHETVNQLIEQSIEAASHGAETALRQFFRGLLEGPLFIPDRRQSHPMSDAPPYPNDLVSVLGVQTKEGVVVPIFTRASLIKKWSGLDLTFRQVSGAQSFSLVPEGWSAVINPGEEVEKELSPWEIAQLLKGTPAIDELVAESLSDEQAPSPVTVRPVPASTFEKLQAELCEYAATEVMISELYMLIEEQQQLERNKEVLLIGVAIHNDESKEGERIGKQVRGIVERDQIGGYSHRVICSSVRTEKLVFPIFKRFPPFYKSRPLNRIKAGLHRFKLIFCRCNK